MKRVYIWSVYAQTKRKVARSTGVNALQAKDLKLGFRDHSPVPLAYWPAAVCNNADDIKELRNHMGLQGCRDSCKAIMRRRFYVTVQEEISCPPAVSEKFEALKAALRLWEDTALMA